MFGYMFLHLVVSGAFVFCDETMNAKLLPPPVHEGRSEVEFLHVRVSCDALAKR